VTFAASANPRPSRASRASRASWVSQASRASRASRADPRAPAGRATRARTIPRTSHRAEPPRPRTREHRARISKKKTRYRVPRQVRVRADGGCSRRLLVQWDRPGARSATSPPASLPLAGIDFGSGRVRENARTRRTRWWRRHRRRRWRVERSLPRSKRSSPSPLDDPRPSRSAIAGSVDAESVEHRGVADLIDCGLGGRGGLAVPDSRRGLAPIWSALALARVVSERPALRAACGA
jgi:hypothetical protein